MPRVVIPGGSGQLGAALTQRLGDAAVPLSRSQFDLAADDPRRLVDEFGATHVVNCAAYNAVDTCESDPEAAAAAVATNQKAVMRLADALLVAGVPLVHLSTDYVFTGAGPRPRDEGWTENDAANPDGVYAATKFAGERAALQAEAVVLRTCGLYGRGSDDANIRKQGGNFVETMLRLSESRDEVSVVDDQSCTPTSCDDLADWIAHGLDLPPGLYHATNSGHTTWAEFARTIFRLANRSTRVVPITTDQFGAPAPRPEDSVLDGRKLDAALGLRRPHWQDALKRYLASR